MRSTRSLFSLLLLSGTASGITQAQGTSNESIINCSQFQSSHAFADVPITVNYVVTANESNPHGGLFSAQVVYEGQGYVAMAISPNGRMVGSLAFIGLPDVAVGVNNPGKYDMKSTSMSGVTLTDQQTLVNGDVMQNETHTVLTFSKYLQEDGELAIDPSGTNYFLVAAGGGNELGYHRYRASVGLPLQPCQEGALTSDVTTTSIAGGGVEVAFDNKQGLFRAHGFLASIAWGILAPMAIANSMCRHLIPGEGIWFKLHMGLNIFVVIATTTAVALAIWAIQATSGGGDAHHFQSDTGALGKHPTIGFVLAILSMLQAAGGIMRPHLPKAIDGKPAGGKSILRRLWEFAHKLSGIALLSMGWYQCHSGLILYAEQFAADKSYTNVFWAVTGCIAAVGAIGKIHGMFFDTTGGTDKKCSTPTPITKEYTSQCMIVDI